MHGTHSVISHLAISICGTGGIFSEQSTRPTIGNLLDRRFGTIFLYNNNSFMIPILLHEQNLNFVILDERNPNEHVIGHGQ